jgi:Fe-S cluster biogenesis protein NfuA
MKEKVEQALAKIRPALQRDGGDVELVDVAENGLVKVRLKENASMADRTPKPSVRSTSTLCELPPRAREISEESKAWPAISIPYEVIESVEFNPGGARDNPTIGFVGKEA